MSNPRFDGKVVFITGAGSGIGRATAKRFASEGARVFAVDVNPDGTAETIAQVRLAGGTADGGVCDVSSLAATQEAVDRAAATFGGLDVVVNAAGVGRFLRFEEIDEAEWQKTIGVNLNGCFHTIRAAVPHLQKRAGANVVNVASTAGMRGTAYAAHYSASKGAIILFTRSLALEFATRSLRFNCICPGGVKTPFGRNFLRREDFEAHLINYSAPPALGRFAEPEDIADTIAYLASDAARMINGVSLLADGGTLAILDVLARHVRERGAHPFLRHDGRDVSYAAFDRRANQAANALGALGVRPGDRVTLALGNSVDYVVAAFGVLKAGAVLNPVNPALGRGELRYILGHAEPRVVVTDPAGAPNVLAARPSGTAVAAFGDVPDAARLDDLMAVGSEAAPSVALRADDPSTLLYTSGTTGNPKGVLFTHGRTGTSGPHFMTALHLTPADVFLAVTPLFHGNAWGAVVTALHAGGTAAFPKAFHASEFWPLVHATGATVLYTLGTVLAMLLTREPSDLERRNPLRVILGLGSAPIRDEVIRRFGVADVAECFGSTDAGVVTITPLGSPMRAGSCGPAVPGVTIRVVDDAGTVLAPRQVGEILIASPASMSAYFRDPEQTAAALRDGWFHTGDLGWLDEDGWLYFVDRKRDVIRRGGENVSSLLVEKTLREHPAVAEAAVIGVPDPVLGQEIKAFVVAKGPVTEEELRAFAASRLAKFQVPRLWEFRESLPKTPTQRVEKYKLREAHGDGRPLLG